MLGVIILAVSGGLSLLRPAFMSFLTRLSGILSP